ncbi:unnamed protein product [Rotaria magnacalcarata]|uniref:Peptidase M28 domain-containing protein n=1 Tax=Rotaria magnacalcarata TaxID=392030 RepID=A0A819YGF6_9BILA|nr:unnamed protein product [Rotaria magnacalcarata]CAF4152824.1 unnamed protein product [Rotaria magnacalcarata]
MGLVSVTVSLVKNLLKSSVRDNQFLLDSTFAESIRIDEAMVHLRELQRLANANNRTRTVNTHGFNQTLDYITDYLSTNTNYKITKSFFPNADWLAASPTPAGHIALLQGGDCNFAEKSIIVAKYNPLALLFCNDPIFSQPIIFSLAQTNELPALFLPYYLGQLPADAARNPSMNASVHINIDVLNTGTFPVGNMCADTPIEDITKTIVIGSHIDSVTTGPGINDKVIYPLIGSGTAVNLALAVILAHLFQTTNYPKCPYRIRFCWWDAEELSLLGSTYPVAQAENSTIAGEHTSDYLINLNFGMFGSPNYIYGIYDGSTIDNSTISRSAVPGSNKVSALFRDWFIRQKLPWDYTPFNGLSDYAPFLTAGIAAGGLFSGADDYKAQAQRDRYDTSLGQGLGGTADATQDPCYNKACDTIQNINIVADEKMVQGTAFVIESLARQTDLKAWLYPTTAN